MQFLREGAQLVLELTSEPDDGGGYESEISLDGNPTEYPPKDFIKQGSDALIQFLEFNVS